MKIASKIAFAAALAVVVGTPAVASGPGHPQIVSYDAVHVAQHRQRIVSAPFVRPPVSLVAASQPLIVGPCLPELRTNWINGAPVETRTAICRWSDGTVRPTR